MSLNFLLGIGNNIVKTHFVVKSEVFTPVHQLNMSILLMLVSTVEQNGLFPQLIMSSVLRFCCHH